MTKLNDDDLKAASSGAANLDDNTCNALMVQELHHRSKNVLQSIAALLSLSAGNSPNPNARAILHSAVVRLQLMAEVHAMIYRTGEGTNVLLRDYIAALCSTMERALDIEDARRVRFEVQGDNPEWPEHFIPTLGMLVSEIIVNTLKHAFPSPRPGIVTVRINSKGGVCCISVEDNGVGFNPEARSVGLGKRLTSAFANRLGGSIETTSVSGIGTSVRITVPAPEIPKRAVHQ